MKFKDIFTVAFSDDDTHKYLCYVLGCIAIAEEALYQFN